MLLKTEENQRILMVGLGNPGYKYTRHNLGADCLDYIIENNKSIVFTHNISIIEHNNTTYILYRCPDLMNISGKNVAKAYVKFQCTKIVVFMDDMETNLGTYRKSFGMGSNGHNGIKSIVEVLKKPIHRIRLGIGRPVNKEVNHFVLEKFTPEERDIIKILFESNDFLLIAKNLQAI